MTQSRLLALVVALALLAGSAAAGTAETGFLTGVQHPFLAWNHLTAMVAVGLWSAFLGVPELWILPLVFPAAMAAGGGLAFAGIGLPSVEIGVAASALGIGLMVALALRPPVAVSAAFVAAFAFFHGHAHGSDLPLAASPVEYVAGFLTGTLFLHLTGVAIGALAEWPGGQTVVRAFGAAIAFAGIGFLSAAA